MSSHAGRKERVSFDFYPTPPWTVHRLLDRHGRELGIEDRHPLRLLEPNVGDGAIVRAVDAWLVTHPRACGMNGPHDWTGVELRRGALDLSTDLDVHVEGQDFRTFDPWEAGLLLEAARYDLEGTVPERFDLALGNPPFSIAEAIIRRALEVARAVAMLLRLDFLGSADRVPFWAGAAADPWIRVLPDRPSFDGDGTDSSTYAWFLWNVELSGPRVDVLDPTPASVRSAQKPIPPGGIPQLGFDL
jgi:hypothetical protein